MSTPESVPHATGQNPLGVDGFNTLPDHQRTTLLLGVCGSPAWARRVLAGAPFATADALLDRAELVLAELPDDEIDAALDGHPRIGAPVSATQSPSSAREQARVGDADDGVRAELAAKNRDYDDKFGYVYLVCATGRSAEELLAILTDRLDNDPDTERRVMRRELAKINRLRLERLLGQPGAGAGSRP